jgi:hypothetical protein
MRVIIKHRNNFLKKMPILQNVLLGILVGYQLAFARVDSIWWPYLTVPVDKLKSKVSLTSRGNAAAFYRSMNESPYNLDYFLLSSWILVLLGFVGAMVQHPKKRIPAAISLLLTLAAGVVELVYAKPLVKAIISKSSGKLLDNLFNLGYFHAIVFACLVVSTLLTISSEAEGEEVDGEDDEEEEGEGGPEKKKKRKDISKEKQE